MRFLIAILPFMLAGCGQGAPQADVPSMLKVGHYFQQNGNGLLCIEQGGSPQRAVFIAFAKEGTTNCSADGALKPAGKTMVLVPKGEGGCRITFDRQGDQLLLRPATAACAYYCGPGAQLGGQTFAWTDTSTAEILAEPLFPDDRQGC